MSIFIPVIDKVASVLMTGLLGRRGLVAVQATCPVSDL